MFFFFFRFLITNLIRRLAYYFNPKRAGLFGPISQPGGDSAPQDLGNRLMKHQVCGTSG